MELLDFSQLPATVLTAHPLLQPLVSLHQNQTLEKRKEEILNLTCKCPLSQTDLHRCSGALWNAIAVLPRDQSASKRRPSHGPHPWERDRSKEWDRLSFGFNTSELTKLWQRGSLTDLVVEFRKLHLNFIPLEVVILCLLTHRWDQVELACHRVRFLVPKRQRQNR